MESPCAKYITTPEKLKETIDRYGIAIIQKVINNDECETMLKGVHNYFEHITQDWEVPFKIDNKNSWKQFYKLLPLHNMMVQYWSVGHSQVCWDLRQNPKIVDVFATLWECEREDLLVSFDGLSFQLPPEQTGRGWFNKSWYHTDQSYTRNKFECCQSYVSALDVREGDATLVVLESSNKYHGDFAKHFNIKDKDDWYKLKDEELKFYTDKGCQEVRIICGKGDLVIWDSKTLHFGSEAIKGRQQENMRCISYLCYMKREGTSEANLKKKRKAFDEMRTTKHNAQKSLLFAKNPRTYSKEEKLPEITEIDPPVLTELGKKLAGF
jgi:ectoine hydroxylase-related dioxygenase (phytanoyl-CoA dioxygenase family)